MGELSKRHKAFVDEYLINGLNARQAYLKNYPDCKTDEGADASASTLLSNPKVLEYLKQEQDAIKRRARMSKDDKLGLLESIMAGENKNLTIKAIEVHNKMTGDNEAEKIDVKDDRVNINYNKPKK